MEEILKILVVDDDLVDAIAVRRSLQAAGASVEVWEARNYSTAIALLQQQSFDCVFLDYSLPDANGLQLVQEIRAAGIKVPLVVLTEQGDEQIAVEVMKAGASDYLSKERVSAETLFRAMSSAIRVYRAEREAAIAQAHLQESEERYRLVLEGSNDAIWDWDITRNQIYWNNRIEEIIGISAAELSVSSFESSRTIEAFFQLIYPEDRKKFKEAIIAHICDRTEFNLEFRLRHNSGEYRYCRARGKAQRDARGKPVRMAGIISDISPTKQAETELRRSFEQLQMIYQITEAVARASAPEEIYQAALNGLQRGVKADRSAVLLLDSDRVMRFKTWCGLSENYRRFTEAHLPWLSACHSLQPICISDVQELQISDLRLQILSHKINAESSDLIERISETSIQSEISNLKCAILSEGIRALAFIPLVYQEKLMGNFILYYNTPHQFSEEEIQLAQTIASNVAFATERKQAEEHLHRHQQEFKALVENSPDVITRYDREFRYLYASPALERATGIVPETIIGKTLSEIEIPESLSQQWQEHLRHVFATGEEQVLEFDYPAPDGTIRYYQARFVAELAPDGSPESVLCVARDITQRKRAEDSQRFLADASRILSSSLEGEIPLENLANLAVAQIADWCVIDLVEIGAREESTLPVLKRVAIATKNSETEGGIFCLNAEYEAIAIRVAHTGKSQLYVQQSGVAEQASTEPEVHFPLFPLPSCESVICVPLVARGRILGVITLGLVQSGRRYTQVDLDLAEDLGRRAAMTVDNARLYQQSQKASGNLRRAVLIMGEQQQQLRTLQRLTNLVNQHLASLPDLLQVMVQSLCDAVEAAEFCCIVLNNPQCDRLILTVTTGIGTEKLRLDDAISNGEGWLNQAISTTQERGSRRNDSSPNCQIPASACAVTIESPEGGRLGVLAIGNWEDRDAFDEEDRNLLVAVGEQAAIAINNARLIKTLEEREDRLANQNETLASQNQELEHQRQQIQLQNLQLMEAARLKSQFLATMSHELRTPMNAIIGFSQLLLHSSKRSRSVASGESSHQFKAQPLTAEQENMVQRILDNGKHLLSLIDDILDLSKIESGRLELEPEQLNLANLVQATIEELRSLAEEKHLDLQVDARLSNPLIINDSVRLRQILMNLISNAIKFTERGVVQIEVWEYSPNCISLTVKDTGIGIAQENLEHIFEAFRQVDQSLSKRHYGTGLGLAITKSLIQMMNGSITVHSMLGEGSIFRVDIPRDIPVSAAQRETGITRKTIR